jgi:hypothetical protein
LSVPKSPLTVPIPTGLPLPSALAANFGPLDGGSGPLAVNFGPLDGHAERLSRSRL